MKRDRKQCLIDGRVYFSTDGWKTVWQARGASNGRSHRRILDRREADAIRAAVKEKS